MPKNSTKKSPRVFISHASVNLKLAKQVEKALDVAGFDPWLDHSDIRVGVLLGKELQQAIKASQAVVLIWSKAAAASRWVAAEVLTAFHLNRFIVPCVLSATELPQFLSRSVYLDLRRGQEAALNRLGEQVGRVPRARNEFLALSSYWDKELEQAIYRISAQQRAALAPLDRGDLPGARKSQAKLDTEMRRAEKRWRYDPTILNLAGYHRKNAYMLKHWDEYCAGRFPKDPLLQEGERYFLDTLFVNPVDYNALNGLGNILFFEGELDAAEFFVERAIKCAKNAGMDYQDAKQDLRVIRSRTRAPELGRMSTVDGRRQMKRSETKDH
jgi:tetratricopeptide (TPR) repeat protein